MRIGVFLAIAVLPLTVFVQTANAALTIENVRTWYWTDATYIWSVARGDVDGDTETEIVTGGDYWDGSNNCAQLCVWA